MSYGCYNRPPLKDHHWVQVGYGVNERLGARFDKMAPVADLMTKTCQYQRDDKYGDPGCVGCIHKTSFSGNALDLFKSPQAADTEHGT